MERVIIAPDSFKESLSAGQAAVSIARGFKKVFPGLEATLVPMSDGGEGLVRTIAAAIKGVLVSFPVTGPLNEAVEACYCLVEESHTAVIEMALASGLALVPPDRRNPLRTTSFGTGELIRKALEAGCRKIIVGAGGSATNDGGAGMAQALGARLLDAHGKEIERGAEGLLKLARIDLSDMDPRLRDTRILAAVDVTNPLCGPAGASYVYGPQKGATPEMLPIMDQALLCLAVAVSNDTGKDILNQPGAGAAGGLGGGLMAFLDAELRPGFELVSEAVGLESILSQGADLVITGEGEINQQTAFGKVPVGVAKKANEHDIPVVALVGSIGDGAEVVLSHGIDAYFSLVSHPMQLGQAIKEADSLLSALAEQVARLVQALYRKNCGRGV
ncbi:MAG: glycerate kinase family protein [Bacillota bacterium]